MAKGPPDPKRAAPACIYVLAGADDAGRSSVWGATICVLILARTLTKVRERYERSRINLIRLLPRLTALRVFDNSMDADPAAGRAPMPALVLHIVNGTIVETCELSQVPEWAKPIVAAALTSSATR